MSIIPKIFLTIIFIPVFLILLILVSFKLQILSPSFWTNTFNDHGVYQGLETIAPKVVDYQIKNNKEIKISKKVLVSLLTKDNLKEFFEKNINHTLNYANGVSDKWTIFIPTKKLPKGLLPNFLLDKEDVSLDTLLSFLGRGGEETKAPAPHFSLLGSISTISLIVWSVLVLLILFSLYRVGGAPIALFLTGALTLGLIGIINAAKSGIMSDLLKEGNEPAKLLLGTITPPVISEVTNLWIYFAVASILLAAILRLRFFHPSKTN